MKLDENVLLFVVNLKKLEKQGWVIYKKIQKNHKKETLVKIYLTLFITK